MGKEIVVRNAPGRSPYSGREFLVRVLEKGDRYGLGNKLVYDQKEPQIEFYDTKYADDPRFAPDGQFVQRYYAFTLADPRLGTGLDLWGTSPRGSSMRRPWTRSSPWRRRSPTASARGRRSRPHVVVAVPRRRPTFGAYRARCAPGRSHARH